MKSRAVPVGMVIPRRLIPGCAVPEPMTVKGVSSTTIVSPTEILPFASLRLSPLVRLPKLDSSSVCFDDSSDIDSSEPL